MCDFIPSPHYIPLTELVDAYNKRQQAKEKKAIKVIIIITVTIPVDNHDMN